MFENQDVLLKKILLLQATQLYCHYELQGLSNLQADSRLLQEVGPEVYGISSINQPRLQTQEVRPEVYGTALVIQPQLKILTTSHANKVKSQ